MICSVIVPHNYSMPMETVRSFLNLSARYSYHIQEGPSLPDNRNRVVEYVKLTGEDLLFIDSDIVFTPEDVAKIEEHLKTKDAVTGVYAIGRGLYSPCLFRLNSKTYEKMPIPATVSEIGACGGGFLGISADALQVLGDDPFTNIWNENIQDGEDISFCKRVHDKGLKLWVDPTILLGHVRNTLIYP